MGCRNIAKGRVAYMKGLQRRIRAMNRVNEKKKAMSVHAAIY
jgi:hypothetical protein